MTKQTKKCCICGRKFSGWGNNPWPLRDKGECCDWCNTHRVIPMRIFQLKNKSTKTKDYEKD